MGKMPERSVEKRDIATLKPHAKQAILFPDAPQHEIEELAEQLKGGLINPVEILPDGTIVAGHRRTLAAKLLGWAEVDVWVRHDLVGMPEAAEQHLILDNLVRRQLGPLALARCYQHLREIERTNPMLRRAAGAGKDLRDLIGQRLGMSGRTLSRYLRVLQTPLEVQAAVDAGMLPMGLAEKVASLETKTQEQIAEELRQGGDASTVVRSVVAQKSPGHKQAGAAITAFIVSLDQGTKDLHGRIDRTTWINPGEAKILRDAQKVIRTLLKKAKG